MTNMRKAARVVTAAVLIPSAVLGTSTVASAAEPSSSAASSSSAAPTGATTGASSSAAPTSGVVVPISGTSDAKTSNSISVAVDGLSDGTKVSLSAGDQELSSNAVKDGKVSLDYSKAATAATQDLTVKVGDAEISLGEITCKGTKASGNGMGDTNTTAAPSTDASTSPTTGASTSPTTGASTSPTTGESTEPSSSSAAPTSAEAQTGKGTQAAGRIKPVGPDAVAIDGKHYTKGEIAAGEASNPLGVILGPIIKQLAGLAGGVIPPEIKAMVKSTIGPLINMAGGVDAVKALIGPIATGAGIPSDIAGLAVDAIAEILGLTDSTSTDPTGGSTDPTGTDTNPAGNTSETPSGSTYDIPVTVDGNQFKFTINSGDSAECTGSLASDEVSDESSTDESASSSSVPTSQATNVASPGANYGPKSDTGGDVEQSTWAKVVSFFR